MSEIITSIEAGRTRSWVDPIGASELSSLVCRELRKKFQAIKARGGKVYFVTLTYDPSHWLPDGVTWAEADRVQREQAGEACWDAMTTEKHVHNFIDRLEDQTGVDFSGRWWSKREFTKNGFLHHHLIIDGPEFLPFDRVHECWGFGRIDAQVARTEDGLAWYVGKYCTKFGDEPPAWIYNRPAGSLRFTTCSDRWWSSDLGQVRPAKRAVPGVTKKRWNDRMEDAAYNCYETVGMVIARKSRSVTVRCNGERETVEGVTLEDFRRHRHHQTSNAVIKARRSMDAVVGLSMTQACRELREIGAYVRSHPLPPPSPYRPASGSDAGPGDGGDAITSPSGPADLLPPLYPACVSEEKRRHRGGSRPPEALPRLTGTQLSLYPSGGVSPSGQADGPHVPAAGPPSEASGGGADVARALLTLSSPQESNKGKRDNEIIKYKNGPPPLP